MSLEDLENDLVANLESARDLSAMSTIGDITNHLKNTLWPFLQNVTQELADQDSAMRDLYENAEDILQHETGKKFAAMIVGAVALVGELKKRAGGDPKIAAAIKEWEPLAKETADIVEEITLPEDPDELEPDDDEDEEEDDDDADDQEDADGSDPGKREPKPQGDDAQDQGGASGA